MEITSKQAAKIIVKDIKDFELNSIEFITEETIKQMVSEFCEFGDIQRKKEITTLVIDNL